MPALLIASLAPLSGKTAVAVGLAQRLSQGGKRVALLRLKGDEAANLDAALLASLPFNSERRQAAVPPREAAQDIKKADVALMETPAGDLNAEVRALDARAVVVARYGELAEGHLADFCRSLGDGLLGVVATTVPRRRLESAQRSLAQAGLPQLALIPEDRTLASPTIGELAEALGAQALYLDDLGQTVLEGILIASISADPGQGYFARYNPKAVIVRSDKPDLQLAALNAGAPCLVLTGGRPPLSYVLQRAEEDGIPILITRHDTLTTVSLLEELYSRTRFGGEAKVRRIGQLMAESLGPDGLRALAEMK